MKITPSMLSFLLNNSEIVDIESDAVPFTHKLPETQTRYVGRNEN